MDESLFVSPILHERAVDFGQGRVMTLHFREVPAVEFIRFHGALQEGSEEAKASAAIKLIAACLCNPDGSRAMTLEKAMTLKNAALNPLLSAVMDVNGIASGNG